MFPIFDRARKGRPAGARRPDPYDEESTLADPLLPQRGPTGSFPSVGGPGAAPAPATPDPASDPRTVAAILRSAPDAVVLFDGDGLVVDWSPAAERLIGYSRGEIVGRSLLGMVFPERLHGALEGVLANRGASWGEAARRAIEVSVLTRDGEEIPAEMTLAWAPGSELFVVHLTDARERGARELQLAADARRKTDLNGLGQVAIEGSLERLYPGVLRSAAEHCGFESAEAWDYDAETGELVLRRALGPRFGRSRPGTRITPAPESRLAAALAEQRTDVIFGSRPLPDPMLGPESLGTDDVDRPGAAAIIAGADGLIGALTGRAPANRGFGAAESAHLTSLAIIVAAAVERNAFIASITDAERKLRSLMENLPAITYTAGLGANGTWAYVSPQVEEMFGYTVAECMEDSEWWARRVHPDDYARVMAEEERCAAAGEPLDIEYRMRDRHGAERWIRDRAIVVGDEAGEAMVEGLLFDITSQKLAEERLRTLADHDHLTGLLNRRGFEEAVDADLAADAGAGGGALAVIDLDHMKRLNDTLGHAAGDAELRAIAQILSERAGPGRIVGRLGSDEFALYAPGVDSGAAERLLQELTGLIRSRQTTVALTASAGVALADGRRNAAELIVAADIALYESKQLGRDRVVLGTIAQDTQMDWMAQVREAVDEGRLDISAQPIFDLRTGAQHSEELLVRMVDREGRRIPAAQFVPSAERCGLIDRVDRWVAARAVEAVAAGRTVNVNLSAASIGDPALTELVGRAFTEHPGADPARLTFEITETGATPSLEVLRSFSDRVAALGCRLSLDDVGTGFGSLTYLQNLDFDQIKIDMQFVRGLGESEVDARIVRSLVTIARELGLETVAEGVGSELVRLRLRELGVDHAQGHHLGSPAPLLVPGGVEGQPAT